MDEAVAVAHRPTLEAVERKRLLQALTELCEEVGEGARGEKPDGGALARARQPDERLSIDDEQLVARLRAGLATLATAAGSRGDEPDEVLATVRTRLDGAESVMCRKILIGQGERLPQLLPSFVFLVLLPLSGHAEALRVCMQAEHLLEKGEEVRTA